MGFLKKIVKGTKNILKGVGKAVTAIPVAGKVIKSLSKSTLGKAVLFGAAIYLTAGLAAGGFSPALVSGQLGSWGGSISTALGGGASAAGGVTTAATSAGATAGTAAGSVSSGLGLSAAAGEAATVGIGSIANGAGAASLAGSTAAANTAAAGAGIGGGGLLGAAKGALSFAKANPLATAVGVNAISSGIAAANTPDEAETAEKVLAARQRANALGPNFTSGLPSLSGGLIQRAAPVGTTTYGQPQQPAPAGFVPQAVNNVRNRI